MMKKKEVFKALMLWLSRTLTGSIFLIVLSSSLYGQEPPPRPLEVQTTAQELSFGSFTLSSPGSVIIYADGSRDFTGGVVLLSLLPVHSTTRLELIANPGTIVSILVWPSSTLSNGINTMSFQINTTSPLLPHVIVTEPPASTSLYLGGTLTVGSLLSNPAGNYSGTFNITFFQE